MLCKQYFDWPGSKHCVWNHGILAGYKTQLDIWMPHELRQKKNTWTKFAAKSLHFQIVMITGGSFTTTSSENSRGWNGISRRKRWPNLDWWLEKFCCVFGRIGRKPFTMSCYSKHKFLNRTCTGRGEELFHISTKPVHKNRS